jgi:hypothetical protein
MKERRKRNNMETLFGVTEIPGDNQIRTLLDGIEPSAAGEVFEKNLRIADKAGILTGYRVLDEGVLPALDGLRISTANTARIARRTARPPGTIARWRAL